MRRTVVLNVVGLTAPMIRDHAPNISSLAGNGAIRVLNTITPAVTCPVQSTFLTGELPSSHGVVANGWYYRDLNEIRFWQQSNRLVSGEKVWQAARKRDSAFTCANLFWWYNMATSVDIAVTPRPMYPADGRKIPDCHTQPSDLRDELTERLGRFPLFRFWGPLTSIDASRWITNAALHVWASRSPTLMLVYLPHLDYNLQRQGPDDPVIAHDVAAVDALCGELIEAADRDGARVIVLSEYAVTHVSTPIHINRALRDAGFIRVREELGRELLDPAASGAFAVCDHQIAHIYVGSNDLVAPVKTVVQNLPGVERVLDGQARTNEGLDHARAGDLVAIARPEAWFTYYYWLDDARCPDFARTVDIHRKPGYDPVELFLDPAIRWPKAALAWRMARSKLGFRGLMDVIPLDASLVKGSHGRVSQESDHSPVFISSDAALPPDGPVHAQDVKDLILAHLFD